MVQKYRKSLILLYFRYLQPRMNAPFSASQSREFQIEQSLRKFPWLIPLATLLVSALLYWSQGYFMRWFEAGHYWVVLFSGMIAHGFFIMMVHDGAHKSITRTWADRYLMNLGAGLMLMPFYAEPFRKFHLIHHSNTNSDIDPLWSDTKKILYEKHRWLYVICSMVPLMFTLYSVLTQQRKIKKLKRKVMSPKLNLYHMAWATGVSAAVIYWTQPSLAYVLSTLLVLNAFAVLRHWCEHVGYNNEHESNTFWFPFGMGVGNHDVHHHVPNLSWLTLSIGLWSRAKTTSVPRALYGVLFDPNFEHYEAK
jgi:fatty acid desaturase